MKRYVGKKMLHDSRFVALLNRLSNSEQDQAAHLVDNFVQENPLYCDKGNYQHLCNIFSSMALYRILLSRQLDAAVAEDMVFIAMYDYMQQQRIKFQRLSKKGWFWSLIKKIVPLGFKLGSGYGWQYTWHRKDAKNIFRFECNKCIYQQLFHKYGLERFGPKFCYNDIIVYGELAQTDFIRTDTLCRGGKQCDFKFIRYQKGEAFTRSKSV